MSDVIQADYEKLNTIATAFVRQGDNIEEMARQISGRYEELIKAWVGQASDSFSAEMDGVVLPGISRLREALAEANRVTLKIVEVVKQAEEEASDPFQGGAAAGGIGNGGVGATAGAAAGGTAGAAAANGQTGSGSNSPWYVRAGKAGKEVVQRAFQIRGIVKGLQTLKSFSDVVNNFSKPLTGLKVAGPLLGVAGGVLSTGLDINERLANGEDFASALSKESGEGTFEVLARLALYSNPYTGIPTLAHDVAAYFTDGDTDLIDSAGEYVGRATNYASDQLADGLYYLDQKGRRAADAIGDGLNAAGGALEDGYDYVADGVSDGIDAVGDGLSDGVDAVGDGLSAVGDFLGF